MRRAAALATATPGVRSVRPYTKEEIRPHAGAVARQRACTRRTPRSAAHRRARRDKRSRRPRLPAAPTRRNSRREPRRPSRFVERMRTMARSAVAVGLGLLALVLAAAMLSVMFATRGAMSTNRTIIEVLHVVGAKEAFIAREFQRAISPAGTAQGRRGGVAAMLLFLITSFMSDWFKGSAGESQCFGAGFGNLARTGGLWRGHRSGGACRRCHRGHLAPDCPPHTQIDGMIRRVSRRNGARMACRTS